MLRIWKLDVRYLEARCCVSHCVYWEIAGIQKEFLGAHKDGLRDRCVDPILALVFRALLCAEGKSAWGDWVFPCSCSSEER